MMSLLLCTLALSLSVASVVGDTWMTQLDQPFNFTCPRGMFFSDMKSAFDSHTRDRHFSFGCKTISADANIHKCTWSGFNNNWDQPVVFQCPNDGIMTGIYGVHDNSKEDRRWKFYCCEVEGYITHACKFTPYGNQYHGLLDYKIEDGWYMRGMESVHDNNQEDRIFRYDICKLDSFITEGGILIG